MGEPKLSAPSVVDQIAAVLTSIVLDHPVRVAIEGRSKVIETRLFDEPRLTRLTRPPGFVG